ncbi:MAG: InlB B-repeat-containing protein, partial [Synergistaceae bacterium]|nr:InlB B-repeat-containing protein [Synergistaceae bacterium]
EISLDVTIPKGSTGDREYKAEWNLITYSISYDLQGGSVTTANPTSYDVTTETFKLNNPTRTGYTFAGWTGTGLTEASTDVTIPTGSTDDRSYTATWTAIEYMISYTLNNGNVSGNPDKYTIESEAITLNNPTKNGYQFTGWTGTDLSGKTQTVTIPTSSTGDRTYTANFSPIVYTISYELNGGTLLSGNPVLYTIESSDITLNNPERAGYTFEGWTGTGLTGATKAVTIAGHSTGNKSYTANWTLIQYDLSFDLGGGVFAEGNPTSYNYETQTFTLNNPTREGYEFLGWSVEGIEGLSMDVTIPQGSTDNRKYTANWKATEYTIGYELNGGTVSPDNPTSYTIESDDFKLTNPTKDGYMFDGWTGTSVDVTESKDVTILKGSTGNREYAANWTLNVYTISYDLDGGAVSSDNPTSYTVESADIKLTQPTKLGYAFAGWSFDSEISLDVTIPKGSTGNRKYQATWEIITYTISYELNGGSVTAANRTSYDVTTEMFKLTNPTRTGYTFAGWTGTGITGTSTDVTILTGTTGNRDYTATWTAIEYTISYTLNNGSVSGNPTSYTIETETFTLNKPSRNGYQFDGWTGTDLSGKTQTVTITQGTIGNRSYTANFSPIEYTITYELNGGTNNADNPTSYTIESATITLKAPTRNAYNFSGWTLNGEAISEIAHGSTGNKTLTATWGETKPIISPASYALTVYKGQSSSLTLNATGTNLEWSISGSLPAGMTFSNTENSATISGTPELGTSGSYAITVTASNAGGSASANVTLTIASDFALSGDVEAGTPATITPEGGGSQTTTQTVFRNGAGQTILTADVAITTESEDFEAIVGSAFTTTVKVDVTLNVADSDYDGYEYSMSITGLPEWLKAEGELESTDMLEVGESTHSHEFTLTGTPTVSSDAETLNLTATVKVSGETPMLEASGSKEVKISVTSPEHIPEILQSLSVKISGDETLITDAGTSASITFTADVKGLYSNGQTRTLPSGGYALTWSASNVEG